MTGRIKRHDGSNHEAKPTGFSTRAIHHGYDPKDANGSLNPPVYMTSTYAFEDAKSGGELFAGEREGYVYGRLGNPTQALLEARLAELEGGEAALATASGMGAISSTLWTLVRPGDELIIDKTLYGCTFSYFTHGLAEFGITVIPVDMSDPKNLEPCLSGKTRVVYFETPANPNMRLVDIAAIRAVIDSSPYADDITMVVDSTYCTPYLQTPLALGADLVVHSATKYLGGHGDVIAGAVVGGAEMIQRIRMYGLKDMTGAVIAPMDAFLILRGLKTLHLRMDAHVKNACALADLLESHAVVSKVFFPGLKSFDQYETAKKQMRAPGGMIAFELDGGAMGDMEAGIFLMDQLQIIIRAVSLGDAETLIQHPASMTHSTYTAQERHENGISDGLIRLSAGLEDIDDLEADLLRALDATRARVKFAAAEKTGGNEPVTPKLTLA
jgi:methionine-gamma-lyase